ncbi:hypothetical protein [Escherichia albertii]|uniref:hypothetical protein n=1 Tax=Escherichia albertii TaxID=208962 RepID=UPI000743B78E|nr:hypothetical protein [Escherichia albertii]
MKRTRISFKSFDLAESILQRECFASVKTATVNAIGHFCRKDKKLTNRAIKLLSKTTYDKLEKTCCATAAAFSSVDSNDTIPFLLTLLNDCDCDCDGDVRYRAVFTINFNQYGSAEFRESFIRMLTDKNDCVRIEAIISADVLGDIKLLPVLKMN